MTTAANTNEPEAVFTVNELATRWRCSRRSVVDKINAGELNAFRIGKRMYRITAAEVERIESTSSPARAAQ